jgi:hypothetical protein
VRNNAKSPTSCDFADNIIAVIHRLFNQIAL